MNHYTIRLADGKSTFELYDNSGFVCNAHWIASIFKGIAIVEGVDISRCPSESHMLAVLRGNNLQIEIIE